MQIRPQTPAPRSKEPRMTQFVTRRTMMTTASAALAAAMLPVGAFAAVTAAQATALVDQIVATINQIISSGKSESAMIADFQNVFAQYSDVPAIARYALGRDARSASPAQMRAFTTAFSGYIARKYGRRFREFIGGQIQVNGATDLPRGIAVQTTAVLRGQAPFRVDFHISDASGRVLFFNIIIEGIDMLLSERTEIGAILDRNRGDMNALIAALQSA